MSARRTERLINLLICLLSTRQFLTAERIRTTVYGYDLPDGTDTGDEAFKRMFERDKSELRELGVPLETGRTPGSEDEGYRIRPDDYELPAIEFDAAEAAAVGLAARLWQSATLGEAANSALVKLRAAGLAVDTAQTPGLVPFIDAADPSLAVLLDAARDRRVVRFDYLKSGAESAEQRTVEPWGVLSWHRRWYVLGYDRGRQGPRSFRLSRIVGTVTTVGPASAFARPEGVDLEQMVTSRRTEDAVTARIKVLGSGAGQLRRLASSESEDAILTISYSDPAWIVRQVAAAGSGVQVLEPPELIAAVRERLAAVAGARV